MKVSKWDHHLTCRQASAIHRECVIAILEYRNSSSDSFLKDRIINFIHKKVSCLLDVTDPLRFCQSHDMKRNIFWLVSSQSHSVNFQCRVGLPITGQCQLPDGSMFQAQ